MSWLNRRFHAKTLLFSTHISTILAFVLLYFFSRDFTFVMAISCISYMTYCARMPLMKLLHSMFSKENFAQAQTIYGSLTWLSAIAGYLSAGILLENASFDIVFGIGAFMAVISAFILKFWVSNNP